MDKGAHFHQCDFQVHSPRDRQWSGATPGTPSERRDFAKAFIAACRSRGLSAVAITDHHDMAFVHIIREAASEEVGAQGQQVAESERIAVFPAMELTLGLPCQAIVIFDADFPEDLFNLALTALAITAAPESEQRTAPVERLSHITTLQKLHEELDKHTYLRGRYIVLPNVSEGGSSTMLRSGYSSHYKEMPCVGGYLDGDVAQLGEGNRRILAGQDTNYGSKKLGIFQTSDSRQAGFADLGVSTTWVKWAGPTAEALRQACLASESRLAQSQPPLPSSGITAINVSNSAFLGPVYLEFNAQYNAFIGGRGTGKSTMLEYLRWALCDESESRTDDDEIPLERSRRRKLIEQTLTAFKGVVDVHFQMNGVPHVVRRNAATKEIMLRIGVSPFETCSEADVRSLLPIQAYSQKQLSNVGVRLDELRRFVLTPIRQAIDDIRVQLLDSATEIRALYGKLRAKREVEREIENDERELRSLTEQASSVRSELGGISDSDRTLLESHSTHEGEAEIIESLDRSAESFIVTLNETQVTIQRALASRGADESVILPNAALINEVRNALQGEMELTQTFLSQQQARVRATIGGGGRFAEARQAWANKHAIFQTQYAAAKARSTSHQTKLDQLGQLEERTKTVRTRLSTKKAELAASGDPATSLAEARERWCQLHEQRSDLIGAQCERLTSLSGRQIQATLKQGSAADASIERLKAMLTGTRVQHYRVDQLFDLIAATDSPVRTAQRVMDELEALANSVLDDRETLPNTPILSGAGFLEKELQKIGRKISPDAWIDLCVTSLDDQPKFEYRLREDDYIPFSDASAGQQATALLWALLNDDGPPLIIDQPEDDLDNQVLLKVVEQIWAAKKRRQLIFSSHNANVVVNGDADLVVCCDYRVTGEQAGGIIKIQGAIDLPPVRDEIAMVMEGGKAAFRLRQEKYGF
jgi:chromosome segregation protein